MNNNKKDKARAEDVSKSRKKRFGYVGSRGPCLFLFLFFSYLYFGLIFPILEPSEIKERKKRKGKKKTHQKYTTFKNTK